MIKVLIEEPDRGKKFYSYECLIKEDFVGVLHVDEEVGESRGIKISQGSDVVFIDDEEITRPYSLKSLYSSTAHTFYVFENVVELLDWVSGQFVE